MSQAPAANAVTRRQPLVPNSVLAVMIFIVTEIMLFMGLISAFVIGKSSVPGGVWPPEGQPVLPAAETAINTVALLLSGAVLLVANSRFKAAPASAKTPLAISLGLGAFFILLQGYEWVSLLGQGLTLTSSLHGSFFYLIIGSHALHAFAGLLVLIYLFGSLHRRTLDAATLWAGSLFWYFVCAMWPLLYWLVYLG